MAKKLFKEVRLPFKIKKETFFKIIIAISSLILIFSSLAPLLFIR